MADWDGHSAKELPAVAGRYLQTVLLPASKGQLSTRDERELSTLAVAIDAMVKGRSAEAADVLAQRFRALETKMHHGTHRFAKHLELVPERMASSISQQDREVMMRLERQELKAQAPKDSGRGKESGGRGASR